VGSQGIFIEWRAAPIFADRTIISTYNVRTPAANPVYTERRQRAKAKAALALGSCCALPALAQYKSQWAKCRTQHMRCRMPHVAHEVQSAARST
jgi:hypothetical protein